MYLFIVLLFVHFLVDYVIQNDGLVKSKREGQQSALLIHVLHYLGLSIALTLPWFSWRWITALLIQTSTHYVLDFFKNRWIIRNSRESIVLDSMDLILHILIIYITVSGFNPQMSDITPAWLTAVYSHLITYVFCLLVISMIFITRTATYLIRSLLESMTPRKDVMLVSKTEYSTGRVIGNLERILIFMFVFSGHLGAIAIIIAAKSIARYKELENKSFAEYYLIGTLTSTIIAILTAFWTQWMIMIL